MTRILLLALLAGCAADESTNLTPVMDGTYQVSWGETTAGSWLDCDGFDLRGDVISWLGSDCREPDVVGLLGNDCAVYKGAGYVWTLCPGPGYLTGERKEEGVVVAMFEAEWLR